MEGLRETIVRRIDYRHLKNILVKSVRLYVEQLKETDRKFETVAGLLAQPHLVDLIDEMIMMKDLSDSLRNQADSATS